MKKSTQKEDLPSREYAGSILDTKMLQNCKLDPEKKKKVERWYMLSKLDLFKYLPVPRTDEISTLSSQSSTLIVFLAILVLFIIEAITLIFNNQPKFVSHEEMIDKKAIYDAPEIAFGYFKGEKLQQSFYDETYFQYQLAQFTQTQDNEGNFKAQEIQLQLTDCDPDWIDAEIKLFCPSEKLHLQNFQVPDEEVRFPTLRIIGCDQKKQDALGKKCQNKNQVESLFAQVQGQYNVITGKYSEDTYNMYQFFVNTKYQNIGESVLGRKKINKNSDYLTSFREKNIEEAYLQNFNQYLNSVNIKIFNDQSRILNQDNKIQRREKINRVSKTKLQSFHNYFGSNQRLLVEKISYQKQYFQWYLSQDKKVLIIDLQYKTIFDLCSFLGGIWGVLCAIFTFLVMKRNADKFYKNKSLWNNFDKVIKTQIVKEALFRDSKSSIELEQMQKQSINTVIYSQNIKINQENIPNIYETKEYLDEQNNSEIEREKEKQKHQVQLISINLQDQL